MTTQKEPLWTKDYISALIVMFGLNAVMSMLFSTLSVYGKGLTGSDFFAGMLATSFTISSLTARLMMGKLFQILTLKRALIIGSIIGVVACGGYVFMTNPSGMILLRMLHGFGFGMATTAAATYITTSLPHSRLLEGVGYSGMVGTVTMALGPSIVLSITKSDHRLFVPAFILTFAVSFLALIFVFTLKDSNAGDTNGSSKQEVVKGSKGYKLGWMTIVPTLIFAWLMFNGSSITAFLSVHALQLNLGNISLFFMVSALFSFLIRLVTTQVVDKLGEKMTVSLSIIVYAICLLVVAYTPSAFVLFIVAAPYGIASGLLSPIFNVWILKTVPKEKHGTANAMFYASLDGGIGSGAMIWSIVAGAVGYSFIYVIGSGLMLAALVIYRIVYSKSANHLV